jgi:hypothetical protein
MPPRTRSPLAHVLADLDAALRPGGHEWYLFGARAAQLRGLRRATVDVDVTIISAALDASEILAPLRQAFTLRVEDVDDFVRTTRVLPLVHDASSVPVDAVLGGPGLEPYFLERSETLVHDGVTVRVPRAEDLVVMKLLAGRTHDLDDALEIVLFDRAAVDLAGVRALLAEIEIGIGEGGLVDALDRLEQRVHAQTRKAAPKRLRRRPPSRPR